MMGGCAARAMSSVIPSRLDADGADGRCHIVRVQVDPNCIAVNRVANGIGWPDNDLENLR